MNRVDTDITIDDDDDRCFGGPVPVGDGDDDDDDDDDDACSPPRSVFPIYVDCLDSQVVGTEDEMHIASQVGSEAEGNLLIGKICDVGRDRDRVKSHEDSSHVVGSKSSPSSTTQRQRQQTRQPKNKRNKIPTTLTPTPTFRLPSGPDPIGPSAQVVVPSPNPQLLSQDSCIHGAPAHIVYGLCTSDLVEGFECFKSIAEDKNTTTTTTKRQR